MTIGRIPSVDGGIQPTIVDAKGDLITAVGADTPARIGVGANDTVLTADSTTSTGLKWAAPATILQSAGNQITTSETTTSTSFTDLATAGPEVTLTTGTKALVIVSARASSSSTNALCLMGYVVSGASSVTAADSRSRLTAGVNANDSFAVSAAVVQTLTAGSNTFTAKYRVNPGTGTFSARSIYVVDLGS